VPAARQEIPFPRQKKRRASSAAFPIRRLSRRNQAK
jgi:hypothetical protein